MSVLPAGTGFAWADDGSTEALALALEQLDAAHAAARSQVQAAIEVARRAAPTRVNGSHAAVVMVVPESLMAWARDVISKLPMAGDDFEPLPGVKLGELRAWVGSP